MTNELPGPTKRQFFFACLTPSVRHGRRSDNIAAYPPETHWARGFYIMHGCPRTVPSGSRLQGDPPAHFIKTPFARRASSILVAEGPITAPKVDLAQFGHANRWYMTLPGRLGK